jgi:hypothetical protein
MRITQFEGACRRASNVQPLVAAGGEPLHTDFAGARWEIAAVLAADDATVILECHNPTQFDATVRVCAESSAAARTILGQAASLRWPALDIPAGATRALAL